MINFLRWLYRDLKHTLSNNVGAVNFDGTNDYIDCGTMGDFGTNLDQHETTIAFWFKTTIETTVVIYGQGNDTGNDTSLFIQLNRAPDSTLNMAGKTWARLRDEDDQKRGGGSNVDLGFYDGNWHHMVNIFKRNASGQLFLDGVEKAWTDNNENNCDNTANFNETFTVGAMNWKGTIGQDGFFPGRISEFAIFNKALTQAQITLLANSKVKGIPLQIGDLALYLPMDDHPHNNTADTANGLVFKDQSGTGNDGTASGCNAQAEEVLSYPYGPQVITNIIAAGGTAWAKALSDTITVSDTPIKAVFKVLSESPTVTNTLVKNYFKILSQTVSVADTLALLAQINLSESITASDTLVKNIGKVESESITVTNAITKAFFKTLSDSSTVTDTLVKNIFKRIADDISVTDTVTMPAGAATGDFIKTRYITAQKGMRPDEIQAMKNFVGKLTTGDIKKMEQDLREMLKDFE